jgi:hypothetical protein
MMPGQPDPLKEGNEAGETAEGGDGFGGGGETDLPSGEDRIT